jgi:hypothetical protein
LPNWELSRRRQRSLPGVRFKVLDVSKRLDKNGDTKYTVFLDEVLSK